MPAKRKSTNVLTLAGAFKEHPARARDREDEPKSPTVDPIDLPAPSTLSTIEAVVWKNLVDAMHAGIMTAADVPALTVLTRLTTRALYDEKVDPKITAQLKGYFALFGLSPSDRSRVAAAKPPPTVNPAFLQFKVPAARGDR